MKNYRSLFKNLLFFIGGILLVTILYENQYLLTGLVVLFTIIQLTVFKEKDDATYFGVGFFLATLVDLAAVNSGAWSYANPLMFGIPAWLPFALGLMSVLLKRIAEALRG